mgnify:CR=1 FL=1|jgi:hypothetical protein
MEIEGEYPLYKIDEIERVRLLFSKFFVKSTDNSHLNIKAKFENIYDPGKVLKSSHKDLIVSILLQRKIVMMIGEEGHINFMNNLYQSEFV